MPLPFRNAPHALARLLLVASTVALLAPLACARPDAVAGVGRADFDESRLVDLSWPFDETAVYWPNAKGFVHRNFPGLARDAAALLVERRVDAVAIDTASLDPGTSRDFVAHQVLNAAGIYGLENVARLEALPARGATLVALPMKIAEGSGAPVRILAILP